MQLSEELQKRGLIYQCSVDSLSTVLDGQKRTVYYGIDPTADSAHAGNFVAWVLLRHLVAHGHRVIFLVGGGTGMIGDPKPDVERTLTPPEVVEARVQKLRAQAENILGTDDILFVNNHEWLSKIELISFLRDIGKHFTVGELIKKDAIATRLKGESGLSYTEFAYPLLQAYDYLQLFRSHGCDVQVGGSDQWGNIIAGVDLIRRKEGTEVFGITTPLVVDAAGKKFGKSEGNAVWLDAEKTSPYDFYQFWFNTSDEQVIDFLKMFTFLSLDEIAEIETEFEKEKSARFAQRRLAEEVTRVVHGDVVIETPSRQFSKDTTIVEALVAGGLAKSKREAREFILSGAVTFDGEKIVDPDSPLRAGVLQRGKKKANQVRIEIEE